MVDDALEVTELSESDIYELEDSECVRKADGNDEVNKPLLQGLKDQLAATNGDDNDIIGFDTYDTRLEERAETWDVESRHDIQLIRLGLRHAAVTGRPLEPWHIPALVDR